MLKLLVLCMVLIAGQAQASNQMVAQSSGFSEHQLVASVQDLERSVHDKVNAQRSSKGLPSLEYNESIASIARQHSENMANNAVPFGHGRVQQRYDDIKLLITVTKLAENVAYAWGYSNPDEIVVQGWINSEGHRKNMEGDYNVTGIGVAQGADGAYYFTQLFAKQTK
ncbi:MAG: CAP domain-containing protein [Chlamydiales bacterium]|nr:CAP domain-containing protein [Chlamydiales bacterium]